MKSHEKVLELELHNSKDHDLIDGEIVQTNEEGKIKIRLLRLKKRLG